MRVTTDIRVTITLDESEGFTALADDGRYFHVGTVLINVRVEKASAPIEATLIGSAILTDGSRGHFRRRRKVRAADLPETIRERLPNEWRVT